MSFAARSGSAMIADPVLVGPLRDHGALVVEQLLEDDHLALDLVARRLDDVQPLVQDQLLPGLDASPP